MENPPMRRRVSRAQRERALVRNIFLLSCLALFLCGATFFGFQTFETARQAVLVFGAPDLGTLIEPDAAITTPRVNPPNLAAGERVNFLLLGIDRRPSERCPCRTDTMMLATLDPKTNTAGVVTIPRDLFVPIPEVGENRINTANFYGELYKYPGGGPALAKKTVEYNFGRRVHFYVLVDFSGFRKAVDAIGGIDVDVAKAIDDPNYPDENFGVKHIFIPQGKVHMNGELALEYARARHTTDNGDFGRSKRQIQVLLAIRDKALRLDIISKLPSLIQSSWGIIETDIQPQDVIQLAQLASKVKTESIKTAFIDETMTVQFRNNQNAVVLWPDRVKIGRLMDQIIPDNNTMADQMSRVQQEAAQILVLNGTGSTVVAEQAARFLQAQGFQVNAIGNADRADYAKTVLVDMNGEKIATVSALAKIFHVDPSNVRKGVGIKGEPDLRVIIGADWTPPSSP
ncbi:MAG: LCP family protein [Chloroflexi bacterium]|nr:LCP family protein [Chloroflexota bacterium]